MNPTSLSSVLPAIFSEFGLSDNRSCRPYESQDGQCRFSISTKIAPRSGVTNPFTLALYQDQNLHGGEISQQLHICQCPAKPEHFSPAGDGLHFKPVLTAHFGPISLSGNRQRLWSLNKGFWIREELTIAYGGRSDNASVLSELGDWEFPFLLEVQVRIHNLASQVKVRGHWQNELWPQGDYSEMPAWATSSV